MFKRCILLGIIIVGMLIASFYILSNQDTSECDRLVNKLENIYRKISQKDYIPLYAKSKSGKCYRLNVINDDQNFEQSTNNYNETKKSRFEGRIIEWFVIGLVIIAIMSLPINIFWRFRLHIPAYLFAMVTALAVIVIPFIFGW
ncbi:hypothetical protein NPX99_08540 [Bartonella sp. 220]|uniref:hypothetical protein n=1 Tax=Bartonella sp. 220B TaxID=2967260 RepID=UPI0022A93761|nr:hypothetical protein [Bartonella sp. 220B]MCZ2159281.1 hypothetical protein [Bartonella sp. 220B]